MEMATQQMHTTTTTTAATGADSQSDGAGMYSLPHGGSLTSVARGTIDDDSSDTTSRLSQFHCESDNDSDTDTQTLDSDSELQERHLRRLICSSQASETSGGSSFVNININNNSSSSSSSISSVPSRDTPVYLSVQPAQRVKAHSRRLKRINSEEHIDQCGGVGGDLATATAIDNLSMLPDSSIFTGLPSLTRTEIGIASSQSSSSTTTSSAAITEIRLRRGWASRLGFSVRPLDGAHVVSHIHSDSVVAKDGRLRLGDVLLQVDDQSVGSMTSEQVIDLLRKTRNHVTLHVLQRH